MPKDQASKKKQVTVRTQESWKKTGEIEDLARKMSPIFLPRKSALNLPPRACCIRLRTRWKRLGYVRSSHSQKTVPTVSGRRNRVYSAPPAPASFEAEFRGQAEFRGHHT